MWDGEVGKLIDSENFAISTASYLSVPYRAPTSSLPRTLLLVGGGLFLLLCSICFPCSNLRSVLSKGVTAAPLQSLAPHLSALSRLQKIEADWVTQVTLPAKKISLTGVWTCSGGLSVIVPSDLPTMSLSRVSSMDGMQMGREGTRESMSHRRMSFNPVSDWAPEAHKRPSVVSTYAREEVSKGKRIGEFATQVKVFLHLSTCTKMM